MNHLLKHFGQESDLRRLVGIIFREFKDQFECASFPRGIVRAKDDSLPHHNVGVHGGARDSSGRIILESTKEEKMLSVRKKHSQPQRVLVVTVFSQPQKTTTTKRQRNRQAKFWIRPAWCLFWFPTATKSNGSERKKKGPFFPMYLTA